MVGGQVVKKEDLKCEAEPNHCSRDPRGFRTIGFEKCKGCPHARIKKWNWVQNKFLWELYHD